MVMCALRSEINGLKRVARPCLVSSSKFSLDSSNNAAADQPGSRKGVFDPSLSALKRGTGGRSSFNGVVATVFGASGFVGPYVCNKLGKTGTQLILPYRGDHYDMLPLKLVGDLGQVLFCPFNLKDEDSIRKAMKHSNVVINLIGRDWETMNYKFKDVNITGARLIAKLARECGVKRLIHLSCLNGSAHPKGVILPDGSEYLRTKHIGEQAVRDEFPDATIFRPADIYGQGDRFLRYYGHVWRRTLNALPMWDRGEKTIKQPVYVSDVAQGIVNALKDPESAGKAYDVMGPKRYLLSELVDWMFRVMRRDDDWGYRRTNMRYSPLFQMRVSATQKFCLSWPVATLVWDKLERDHVTDEPAGNPTLEDLGISLTDLASRIQWELKPLRAHSYYDEELGEFEEPAPAKPLPQLRKLY